MTQLPNLDHLSHAQKDELIRALWAQVQELRQRVAELESLLGGPPKTPNNSSLPPSKGQKPNADEKPKREGPRKGSLGRKGGGRALEAHPDETVITRPLCCAHCQAAFLDADVKLAARYDKIDLPPVKPVVTRVERFVGHCQHCGSTTLAPVPEGLEPGTTRAASPLCCTVECVPMPVFTFIRRNPDRGYARSRRLLACNRRSASWWRGGCCRIRRNRAMPPSPTSRSTRSTRR